MSKIKNWLFAEDVQNDDVVEQEPKITKTSGMEQTKSIKANQAAKNVDKTATQLSLFEPRSYNDECKSIGDALKSNKAIVVNCHRLSKEHTRRMFDFLCGVVYAINGDIQKIGQATYLCSPNNIGVSGKIDYEEADLTEE